jgi:hypothetical protein
VVEVLQAVHLLLAFDLFMVVVGVDPRWLEHSLVGRYPRLMKDRASTDAEQHHPAATPRDYLEKIFQVPFTLPKVGPKGFSDLVAAHLKTREEVEEELAAGAGDAAPIEGAEVEERGGMAVGEGKPGEKAGGGDSQPSKPGDAGEGAETPDGGGEPEEEPASGAGDEDTVENGDAEAIQDRFFLEKCERDFMSRLHRFVPTPRLIKRFVNVYRMLRIGVPESEYVTFTRDADDAEYRLVLLLLALNTGYPRVGCAVLHALASEQWLSRFKITTWDEFLTSTRPPSVESTGEGAGQALSALDLNAVAKDELATVHPLLVKLSAGLLEHIDRWRFWAPRVGRYSMYWRG